MVVLSAFGLDACELQESETLKVVKTLDRQKLDVVNKTRSNIFGWRGQFTPEFVEHPTGRCLQIRVSMHHATW